MTAAQGQRLLSQADPPSQLAGGLQPPGTRSQDKGLGVTCKSGSFVRATNHADDPQAHDRSIEHPQTPDPETKELLQMLAHSVISLKEEVMELKGEPPRKGARSKTQAAPSQTASFELMQQ